MTVTVLENARVTLASGYVVQSLAFREGRVVNPFVEATVRIDLEGDVIVPGLINAHDHLQLNGIAPIVHETPFGNSYDWIEAWTQRRASPGYHATDGTPEERLRHGAIKNLLAGVTTVAHHDPWHAALAAKDFPVSPVKEFAWCHSLRLGASRFDSRPQYGPSVMESFTATPPDVPWIIHLAEGTDAVAAGELSQLDAMGCLAPNTVIVHGVGLSQGDVDRILAVGAAVIWCPSSNLSMFRRTLAPRRLFEAGRLALGTDSRLTGSRDLLEELRVARANSDLTAAELLRVVTTDAARILGLPAVGGLLAGQRADCVVLPASDDPSAALLETTRRDIRAVVRAGMPALTDTDLGFWFERCGIPTVRVHVDGREKLIARQYLKHLNREAEPGLLIA